MSSIAWVREFTGGTVQPEFVAEGVFAGSPACASTERHYKPGTSKYSRYREAAIPAPVATAVFIEYTNSDKVEVDCVTWLCSKHAGTIKSVMARSNWRYSSVEFAEGVKPEDVIRMGVTTFMANVKAEKVREKDKAKADREAAELARAREGWVEQRADYNSRANLWKATLVDPDRYGRVFIRTVAAEMTPSEARHYATRLMALADEAADKTAVAVKP